MLTQNWRSKERRSSQQVIMLVLVFIRIRLISGGLEPVFIHTKNLSLASYYIQFSTNIKMYNRHLGAKKTSISAKAVFNTMKEITIPVWSPNRLISAGLDPVFCHTEKSIIASYYR